MESRSPDLVFGLHFLQKHTKWVDEVPARAAACLGFKKRMD